MTIKIDVDPTDMVILARALDRWRAGETHRPGAVEDLVQLVVETYIQTDARSVYLKSEIANPPNPNADVVQAFPRGKWTP